MTPHCVHCGKTLKGRQRMFCSDRCRLAHRCKDYNARRKSADGRELSARLRLFQWLFGHRLDECGCSDTAFLYAVDESREAQVVNPDKIHEWAATYRGKEGKTRQEVA